MSKLSNPSITRLSPQVYLYTGDIRPVGIPTSSIALKNQFDGAFGDGSHPTTRLCAGVVEVICRLQSPSSILDVGTGTGILARIARARGVTQVVATDIDPEAILSASIHTAFDNHPIPIHVGDESPNHWGPNFDLVAANILEGPLRYLAPALSGALKVGGQLVISGFTPAQIPALRIAFEAQKVLFVSEAILDEWALLIFRRI